MTQRKINVVEWAMKYRQIILTFVLVGITAGIFGLLNMPRNEFPEFVIRQGVIVGVFPGATSEQVEDQVTKEVENYIFGYEEIDKLDTYSHSKEGMMIIFVELSDEVTEPDEFWSKLRLGLQELKMGLPTELLALVGTNDFSDTSALLVNLSSKTKSYRELEEDMKGLEARIRTLPATSKMKRYGIQKEKVFVYFQQEKLNEYSISDATIMGAFKAHELLNYAGELDTGDVVLPIHLPPRFESEKDLEELIVYSDPQGNVTRLKDIARVERGYDEPDDYVRNNGNNSVLLSLEMRPGNNIVEFGNDVRKIIDEYEASTAELEIDIISDQPSAVHNSILHFMKELGIAVVAVILVTMLLLPFRVSAVAAFTIPVTILITIGIMWGAGIELEMVSLAGLIVVLGMVVDNAIVVIDNHVEKLDHGESPWSAAWKAATELFIPVLTATAAICAAFFPMLFFLSGMAGDFVGNFPKVIGIALGVSMIVAMLLVPTLCYLFIKRGLKKKATKKKRKNLLDITQTAYNAALGFTMRFPKSTILVGLLTVGLGIHLFMGLDQKLFPTMERNQFAVEIYLPEGSSVERTEEAVSHVEDILRKDRRVTNIASFIGNGSPRFHTLYAPHMPASNYGQILVTTADNKATVQILDEYSEKYSDILPGVNVRWKQLAMQTYEAPIEVRLSGNNVVQLKAAAAQVKEVLEADPETTWVRDDWMEPRPGISVKLNREEANRLGYAKALVSSSLLASVEGLPVSTVWEEDYPLSVILSKEDHLIDEVVDLENTQVPSLLTMSSAPLRSFAELEPEWTEGNIVRRNGVRTMTVVADIGRHSSPTTVFNRVQPRVDALELPDGIACSYGGESEARVENFVPMTYSLAVSVVLIFFILLIQFKRSRTALLIMSTMLLSVLGAVVGLMATGYPFSFTAFIGLMGLMGITVRNGIILIDYALHLMSEEGLSTREAALAAGKRRMRPIFLTSAAAAVGVIPMILSGSALWGPLAAVICFGLLIGMFISLLVLPALFWKVTGDNPKGFNEGEA